MSDDASRHSRPPHQPHDKLFKSAFSDLETAAAFLRTQIPPRLATGLDWSSMTIEAGSFIGGQLQGSACDLLYRVRWIGSQGAETDVFSHVMDVPPEWKEELLPMIPKFAYRLVQLAEMPFERIEGTPWGVLVLRALKATERGVECGGVHRQTAFIHLSHGCKIQVRPAQADGESHRGDAAIRA